MFLEVDEIPELDGGEIAEIAHEIEGRIHQMRDDGMAQARNLTFHIDLAELFPRDAQPGDEAIFDLELVYADGQGRGE